MEECILDFRDFCERIKIEGFLYLPSEFASGAYRLEVDEKNGAYRMRMTGGDDWLTEIPYLNLYQTYESCGQKFDTKVLKKILLTYTNGLRKAAQDESREQTKLAALLSEFPQHKIYWLILPGDGKKQIEKRYPGRFNGTSYMIYAVLTDDENEKKEIRTTVITDEMLKKWNRDERSLYEAAEKNMPLLFPYDYEEIETAGDSQAFIISNVQRYYGLGTLLYKEGPLKEISLKLEQDLIVLPLSVHEAAAFPASGKIKEENLSELVAGVSPFGVNVWYYSGSFNEIAYSREERAGQEAILKNGLLDAAERRMIDGNYR